MHKMANNLVAIVLRELISTEHLRPWHGIVLLIPCLVWVLLVGRRPGHYPPGPPTVPLLGNLLQVFDINVDLTCQNAELSWLPDPTPRSSQAVPGLVAEIRTGLQFDAWTATHGCSVQ